MNVQWAHVIRDVSGLTGQAIVGPSCGGERDPYKLAELSDAHIQARKEEIARSLEGTWREDVLFELQQAVDSYHFAQRRFANVTPNGKLIWPAWKAVFWRNWICLRGPSHCSPRPGKPANRAARPWT